MRILLSCATLGLVACGGRTPAQPISRGFQLPESAVVLDAATGATLESGELLRRVSEADLVLLGELHDNGVHHEVRARLIAAAGTRRPAVVFEQLAESGGPITAPAEGEDLEEWLDRNGFDRQSWRWPLHRPVIEAALRYGSSVWGGGISRERLRSVVQAGEAAAEPHLRVLLEQAPLDEAGRRVLDRDLVEGHCGQLPEAMREGMRAAQTVRDAAMTNALLLAAKSGPAWLIAGNGHVRSDIAVPRLLRALAPDRSVLTVGFLERTESGGAPERSARVVYDIVVVTPRAARPDPCAAFRIR